MGTMSRQGWALLLAACLFAPLASAASGEGAFVSTGSFFVEADATAEGEPLALYVPQTSQMQKLEIRVAKAHVLEYRVPFLQVDPQVKEPAAVQSGPGQGREWVVMDALIRLIPGDHEGFLGLEPSESSLLSIQEKGMHWEPRAYSYIGTRLLVGDNGPGGISYGREISKPHFHSFLDGGLTYDGQGAIKLVGPDVEISSSTVSQHRTGEARTGAAKSEVTILFIRFDASAQVEILGTGVEAALARMDMTWDGALHFLPTGGSMRTEEGTYLATGQRAKLEGDFEASVEPVSPDRAKFSIRGDVRASTMSFQAGSTQISVPAQPSISLLVLASVTLGAGGGAVAAWGVLRRRSAAGRGPALPFSAEDCQEAGAIACAEEDWARGAEWFERGVALAPTSARLHADLAFCLSQIGDVERALDHYGRAHGLCEDGEAAFNAACAAVAAGLEAEAERWLRLALARSPEFAAHLDEDPEWEGLLAKPDVEALVRDAWERLARRRRGSGGDRGRPC